MLLGASIYEIVKEKVSEHIDEENFVVEILKSLDGSGAEYYEVGIRFKKEKHTIKFSVFKIILKHIASYEELTKVVTEEFEDMLYEYLENKGD